MRKFLTLRRNIFISVTVKPSCYSINRCHDTEYTLIVGTSCVKGYRLFAMSTYSILVTVKRNLRLFSSSTGLLVFIPITVA